MEELDKKLKTDFVSSMNTDGGSCQVKDGCIFCKIGQGKEPKTNILFENEAVCVFHDIRPATDDHLLVVPKTHYGNIKSLDKSHIQLLEYLHLVGESVIEARGGNMEDSRVGFHWPPFHSIEHLHLHVIYPASRMRFLGRLIFRPNSYWFVNYDWALDWLSKKQETRQEAQREVSDAGSGTHI